MQARQPEGLSPTASFLPLPRLFRRAFGLSFDACSPEKEGGKRSFSITDREKLRKIFDAFGGEIDEDLPIGLSVPAYLVNAPESVVSYWRAANGTDAGEGSEFYNSTYVQKKVFVAEGGDSFDRENVQTAWRNVLSRTMRLGVAANVVVTTMDQSEWVLMDWLELEDIGLNRYSLDFDAASGTAEYYTEYKTKSVETDLCLIYSKKEFIR